MRKLRLRKMRNIGSQRKTTVPLTNLAQAPTVRRSQSVPVAPFTPIVRTKSKAAQRTLIIRGTCAVAPETYAVGDKYGTIGTTLAPRPVNTVFSGTFSTETNDVLENISVGNPFHIRQLRVEVSATSVFTTSQAKILYGDYDGSTDTNKIQFSQAKRPSNYDQTQLLFDNFNVTFDAFTALIVTQIAVAEYMEFDMELDMVATIYNMQA
jgi:hypothetical protein